MTLGYVTLKSIDLGGVTLRLVNLGIRDLAMNMTLLVVTLTWIDLDLEHVANVIIALPW